ncbi:MAG: 6,7-dimethyl-8-ribityllumazine synthase [Rhodospirillaceae bacterium]|jgi:6,7-dimethyl-8-ribityllumazine synthase|nr:6,7-dimethyl-8-ribityllumazine synthase [Rhodospirillaceae bacterium]MBT3495185.1 6,7-dimethyl-8-ribityllumazine synthase [Rhodospirillaceae bacterium]MBT3781051.1 6,7-dimethyl-8-ribityllumazine synthase [Rhodospirillaceae bacterium]MBT3977381.1 6,7-dimethyl-8-ribityllumazine synthase [Rhodospirillaceae bacterium]MBT4565045.1 6,7-dimethyl-8-ribityllumazine synthase [Rhodospirillaceae bacterium]
MSEAPHLLIIEAPYYRQISDELGKGAAAALDAAGATYDRLEVPGAFEIPAAIRMNIKAMELVGGRRRYDGYIALGCVIRGETTHYDYVCGECARGLMDLSLEFSIAVGFGVLTVENEAQAWARASLDKGNKGGVVADAALRMIEVKREFGYFPR